MLVYLAKSLYEMREDLTEHLTEHDILKAIQQKRNRALVTVGTMLLTVAGLVEALLLKGR